MKLHIETEGTKRILTYKRTGSEKRNAIAAILMMTLMVLFFYLIIMEIFFYDFQELIVLLSPVLVILFPLGMIKIIKKDILIIDSSTRTCKHNEERFTVSKKAAVTLKRVYSFSGSGSDNTPH
ncbi:MAG: hypothetical protein ACTSP4_17045 [Candidatus Hodarchaeales archaeon]